MVEQLVVRVVWGLLVVCHLMHAVPQWSKPSRWWSGTVQRDWQKNRQLIILLFQTDSDIWQGASYWSFQVSVAFLNQSWPRFIYKKKRKKSWITQAINIQVLLWTGSKIDLKLSTCSFFRLGMLNMWPADLVLWLKAIRDFLMLWHY